MAFLAFICATFTGLEVPKQEMIKHLLTASLLLSSFFGLTACDDQGRTARNQPNAVPSIRFMNDSVAMAAFCTGKRVAVSFLGAGPNAGDTASVDTTWTWKATTAQIKKRYSKATLGGADNLTNVDYSILNTLKTDSLYIVAYLGSVSTQETSGDIGSGLGIISFAKRNGTWAVLNNNFNVLAAVVPGNLEYRGDWIGNGGVDGGRILTAVVVPEHDDDRTLLFDQFGKVDEGAPLNVAMDERRKDEQKNNVNAASPSPQAAVMQGQTSSEESHQTSAGREFVIHWSKRLPRYTTQPCDARFYRNLTLFYSETMTVPQGKVWVPLYGMSCPTDNCYQYSDVKIESDEEPSGTGCYFGTLYKLPDNNKQKSTDRALHEFKHYYGGTKVKFWGFVAHNQITILEQSAAQ